MFGPFARISALRKGKRKNQKKIFEKLFYPTKPILLIMFCILIKRIIFSWTDSQRIEELNKKKVPLIN